MLLFSYSIHIENTVYKWCGISWHSRIWYWFSVLFHSIVVLQAPSFSFLSQHFGLSWVQGVKMCAVLAVSMLSVHGFIRWRRCWIVLVEYWQMTLAKRICCMHNSISGISLITFTHTHIHRSIIHPSLSSYSSTINSRARIKWHYFIPSRVFYWTEQETDIL